MELHFFVEEYGCPVHSGGHSETERRCSCRHYWAEDPSPKAWREDHHFGRCAANGGACAENLDAATN